MPSTAVVSFSKTFTSNFRTGPSVFMLELMLSATTMPRRRSWGRLLSKWHFTPSIMLVRSSETNNQQTLHVWNSETVAETAIFSTSLREALPTHHTIMDRQGPWTVASFSAVSVVPFSTSTANPHPSMGVQSQQNITIYSKFAIFWFSPKQKRMGSQANF